MPGNGSVDEPTLILPGRVTQGSGLGVAIGPALVATTRVDTTSYRAGTPSKERRRLEKALAKAEKQLANLAAQPVRANAAIFGAQRLMLLDDRVDARAFGLVEGGIAATDAWAVSLAEHRLFLRGLPDAPGQLELADSVLQRVLAILTGAATEVVMQEPAILVLPQLDPGDAVNLDPEQVLGVVTIGGGTTGHGVIIARSRGIPIYPAAGKAVAGVKSGDMIAFVNRSDRRLVLNPNPRELSEFRGILARLRMTHDQALAHAREPALTTDGTAIEVYANVLNQVDAEEMVTGGADGWVLRTEIVFGGRPAAPTVDEQVETYLNLAKRLGNRRVIVRTWDIGGDKAVPFLPLDREDNPFLGVRGLRVFRNRPELLIEQIEAVCIAGQSTPLSLMFPMVTTREELDWALGLLDEVARRVGRPDDLEVGIMIEVPAAALRAGQMTERIDFVSIGTNDLTQYTTAAERGNAALHLLADPLDPAVLRLVRMVVTESRPGTLVAVCGDANTDPDIAALLVGLGVREVTPAAPTVPMVKARLRTSSIEELTDMADRALRCSSAQEVRAMIRTEFH